MKLLVLVLSILLLFPSLSMAKEPLDSIRPLQVMNEKKELLNGCTSWAWRADNGKLYYVTANHCVADMHMNTLWEHPFYIDGKKIRIVKVNPNTDLALLDGGPAATGFRISYATPYILQAIWSAGFPLGSKVMKGVAGWYSSPKDDEGYAVYNLAVARGMSGSPVVDSRSGTVVGIVQQTECWVPGYGILVPWCPQGRGGTLAAIRTFLYGE